MCGVIVFASKNPNDSDFALASKVFEESKIRGLHAFGFSTVKEGSIRTVKETNVRDIQERIFEIRPRFFIGHTRYSTSGDYKNPENNQPVVLPGGAMVFNGCIDMGTKPEMEARYGMSLSSENDGEIFLRKLLHGQGATDFVFKGRFSFAGAYLTTSSFGVLRNKSRPLWRAPLRDGWIFASTKDILFRSGIDNAESVPVGKLIDLSEFL